VLGTRTAVGLLVCSATALGASEGELRLAVQSGYDTNVRRDYDQTGTVVQDSELSVLGAATGRTKLSRVSLWGSYEAGLRTFPDFTEETAIAQALNAEGSFALAGPVQVGLGTHDKDKRGGNRDYSDLAGDAFLEYVADSGLRARLHGAGHRYIYWDNFAYSFSAPEVGVSGRYDFSPRHAASFFAEVSLRTYNSARAAAPGQPTPDGARQDTAFTVGASYTFKGPFSLRLGYSYFEQDSNSFGQSWGRHRWSATAGIRLPWRLFLLLDGALQLAQYPDGVPFSDVLLAQDQENGNTFSAKLVRPLFAHLDVEAQYGATYNHLPTNNLTYLRQLAWVGLSCRL